MPPEPSNLLTVERSVLTDVLEHAAAAARLAGHIDAPAVEPIAEHVDAIVHRLTELLGDPAARVPRARQAFDESVDEDGPTQVHERPARPSNVPTRSVFRRARLMALSRVVRGLPEGLLINTIAHELGAVLGPHSKVTVMPSACSDFTLVVGRDDDDPQDDVPERAEDAQ
jgi:hypothetical protein